MGKKLIYVVDDQPNVRKLITHWVREDEYDVREFERGSELLAALDDKPDAVCLDIVMPGMDGFAVLHEIQLRSPGLPVIMVTASDSLETAVEAIKMGAYDFITKPIDRHRLIASLKKAVEKNSMVREINQLRKALGSAYSFDNLVGKSPAMENVFKKIEKVLESSINVFIYGESGTGKELVSRAIHFQGIRKKGPFEAVNCGAIPENLQESEFFGHEKGAFTGAVSSQKGKIEMAVGGTLFLDEVGEMSPSLQVKLLRFLQDKTFEPVGGRRKITADVRIISATNKDLKKEVDAGNFREDLYYRLVVFPINIPPLRERKEDIPLLVRHFINKYKDEIQRDIQSIDQQVIDLLVSYGWPGNIRELENVVFRSIVASEDNRLTLSSIPANLRLDSTPHQTDSSQGPYTDESPVDDIIFPSEIIPMAKIEEKAMQHALKMTHGNLTLAAKKLGMGRATFYRKMEKYHLSD